MAEREISLTAPEPAWVECPLCEDYFCTLHNLHVYDCACPPLEDWGGVNPYLAGAAPVPAKAVQHLAWQAHQHEIAKRDPS